MMEYAAPDTFASPDSLFLLLIALAVEAVVGDLRFLFRVVPHPVRLVGSLVGELERRLNREKRSEKARLIRGAVTAIFLAGLACVAGIVIAGLSRVLPHGWILELFFMVVLLAQRSLFNHVRDVSRALQSKGLKAGREAVSHIVGRDPDSLDEHAVARAAIESCAENFSDAVVAPVFWYVLLGLPGLFLYKTVNTMDSMIGYKTPRYRSFGMTAARLDDALSFIPARIAGFILVMAALFAPAANPKKALLTMLRDAHHHSSPNAGWPEAAVAGALALSLAGPRRYGGETVNDKWIGDGHARAVPRDIARTLYLYAIACLIQAGLIAALLAARMTAAGH